MNVSVCAEIDASTLRVHDRRNVDQSTEIAISWWCWGVDHHQLIEITSRDGAALAASLRDAADSIERIITSVAIAS